MKRNQLLYIFLFIIIVLCLFILGYYYTQKNKSSFPPTLVINLDERPDRMAEVEKEFSVWPTKPERVHAVKFSPGWKGCSFSHLKSIKLAKSRNYPWVLIIEDDCIITKSAVDQFNLLLPYLWENRTKWDIFLGGATFLKEGSRISSRPPIYKVKSFPAHFCLIHYSTYDKILSTHLEDPIDPIDVFYANNLRIWTTTPFFAKQRPGKSDISNNTEDYNSLFDEAENTLINLPLINT